MWYEGSSAGNRNPEPTVPYQQAEPEAEQSLHCPGHGSISTWPCRVLEVVQPVLCGQQGCAEGSRTCPVLLGLVIKIAAGFQSS